MSNHRRIDERSLAFGRALAAKLTADPTLLSVAKGYLSRWMADCSPRVLSTFAEWNEILNGPLPGVIAVLTNPDERSTRLRQSNPFAGALSQGERNAILLQSIA